MTSDIEKVKQELLELTQDPHRTPQTIQETCGKALKQLEAITDIKPGPMKVIEHTHTRDTYFIILFPDTEQHRAVARKLSGQKPGNMVPLSSDEIALSTEFIVWPPKPMESF